MTYEQCKALKDAGFSQETSEAFKSDGGRLISNHTSPLDEESEPVYCPTLSELIEACGDDFGGISRGKHPTEVGQWAAYSINAREFEDMVGGKTAIEAVYKLFLALKGT